MKTQIALLLVAVVLAALFFVYMLPQYAGRRDAERTIAMCDRLGQEMETRTKEQLLDHNPAAVWALACIKQRTWPGPTGN